MRGNYNVSRHERSIASPPDASKKSGSIIPMYVPLAEDERASRPLRCDVSGDVSEDSEPDFIDVTELKSWNPPEANPSVTQSQEILVNNIPLHSLKSSTMRSSMKQTDSLDRRNKRTISFNLHQQNPTSYPVMPQEPPREGRTSQLQQDNSIFMTSRWSTSSSENNSPAHAEEQNGATKKPILIELNDTNKSVTPSQDSVLYSNVQGPSDIGTRKSHSLHTNVNRRVKNDDVKRRHSLDGDATRNVASLRDSAIDLVSDEENSEAYTAVSLAGTLSRNAQPPTNRGIKRKYVVIGAAVGFVVAVCIIVTLVVLLVFKK